MKNNSNKVTIIFPLEKEWIFFILWTEVLHKVDLIFFNRPLDFQKISDSYLRSTCSIKILNFISTLETDEIGKLYWYDWGLHLAVK